MSGVRFLWDKQNNLFLNTIMGEKTQSREIRAQEMLKTHQNPRVRERNILTQISEEMKDMKRQQTLHEKEQQRLRQSSSELRQTECDILLAKVRKSVHDQCEEKRQRKMREDQEKRAEATELMEELKLCKAESRMKELEEFRKKTALREFLTVQIQEKKQKLLAQQLEKQREREEMLAIVSQLKDEQLAKRKALEERKNVAKSQIEDLRKNQQIQKQQAIIEKIEEQRNYVKMMQEQDEIRHKREEHKRKQLQNRLRIGEKICAGIHEERMEKQRKDEELENLLVEEGMAKDDIRFQQDIDKKMGQRAQLKDECERYQSEKIMRQNVLCVGDSEYSDKELKRKAQEDLEEDERKLAQKRKLALEQHGAILKMIAEKKLKRAAQAESDMLYAKTVEEQEKEREKIIAQERLRRLKQESIEVLKFLPKDCLRAEDRKLLGLLTETQEIPPFERR